MRKQLRSILLFLSLVSLFLIGCSKTENPLKEEEQTSQNSKTQSQEVSEKSSLRETTKELSQTAEQVVYMTTDISPVGLSEVYSALNWDPTGNVAVKLSTGEPPASNYLSPDLIEELVQSVNGTIVECNTAYGGSRASTAMHMQFAKDHGFTAIAEVDIQDAFLESMGEAGKSVSDYLNNGENIVYINVMNRLSVDCDCDGNPAEPDMHDIGILASTDPVALDQACIDLIYSAEDGQSLINRIESRNGLHTLEYAERIGLGSRTYELVSIDG